MRGSFIAAVQTMCFLAGTCTGDLVRFSSWRGIPHSWQMDLLFGGALFSFDGGGINWLADEVANSLHSVFQFLALLLRGLASLIIPSLIPSWRMLRERYGFLQHFSGGNIIWINGHFSVSGVPIVKVVFVLVFCGIGFLAFQFLELRIKFWCTLAASTHLSSSSSL